VRVKLRVKSRSTGREVEATALVNSGFETTTPQLLIPRRFAEILGLWPLKPGSYAVREYSSPAGLVKLYVLRSELEVRVAVEYDTEPAVADAVISDFEEEF